MCVCFKRECSLVRLYVLIAAACLFMGAMESCSPFRETGNGDTVAISIEVDPTIELISTIYYLADIPQYDERLLPRYFEKVDAQFGPYRGHSAVALARRYRSAHGISGSAPMSLAVHLGPPPELRPIVDVSHRPEGMETCWTPKLIEAFLAEARSFARDTDFMTFFSRQRDVQEKAINSLEDMLGKEDILSWYADFFGHKPAYYKVYICLINGSCNFGYPVTLADGRQQFTSLLGARFPDWHGIPQYPEDWFMPVIIHEFCHSYINPLITDNPEIWRPLGESLLETHQADMEKSGYAAWNVVLFEYLVRACTLRYLKSRKDKRMWGRQIDSDRRRGFTAIDGLVDCFDNYEADRTRYPDIQSFLPQVRAYFEEWMARHPD